MENELIEISSHYLTIIPLIEEFEMKRYNLREGYEKLEKLTFNEDPANICDYLKKGWTTMGLRLFLIFLCRLSL